MEGIFVPGGALAQVMPAIVVQFAVGAVATVPYARRPSANTGLMALTLWLAGAVTIAGQPIIESQGVVVGALSGSAQALMLDDLLAVAWGLSGSFLYLGYLYPERTAHQRLLRRMVLLGHLLVLLALFALVRAACADPQVTREGVWFPVRVGMPAAALIYGLIGKTYILGMQVWACVGCWQSMRRLPYSAMRAAIAFGFCVASAVFVQGLAVSVTQARGQQFFAPPNGPRLDALWLSVGLLCPLTAFSVAGAVRRGQLLFLRRDILALRKRLLSVEGPDRGTGDGLWNWVSALMQPVADVDQLCVELRDLLTARYRIPTEATALAGVWLWQQPVECVRNASDRDIALLLLGATILGIERHVVAPVPLDYPQPVHQRFSEDTDWNIPADARFFQTLERLLAGKATPSVHPLIGEGLRKLHTQLQAGNAADGVSASEDSGETIPARIEAWLGMVENGHAGNGSAHPEEDGVESEQWAWWRPPAHGAG